MSTTAPVAQTEFDYDKWHARVLAADWHDIPKGRYAIVEVDDDRDADDPQFCEILGYRVYERTTPTSYRNGRTVGRHRFTTGTLTALGVDPQRLRDHLARRTCGRDWDRQHAIVDILEDVANGDFYRQDFGRVTGRCGCCGKTLTDPASKARGIGPECIKLLVAERVT